MPIGGPQGVDPVDPQPRPDEQVSEREVQKCCREFVEQCKQILAEGEPDRGDRCLIVLGMDLEGTTLKEIALTVSTSVPTVDRDLIVIRTVMAKLGAEQEEP